MLRKQLGVLIGQEERLRTFYKAHPTIVNLRFEKHTAEIEFLNGMCRECKKTTEHVRVDAMDMLKAEIEELKAKAEASMI